MGLTTEQFMKCRSDLDEVCESLLMVKGQEYAQTNIKDNRLDNFERIAERTASTPFKVLLTYLLKHIDSIEQFVRTGAEGSEPIESRIADARNYLDLLYGMVCHAQLIPAKTVIHFTTLGVNVGLPRMCRIGCLTPDDKCIYPGNHHSTDCEMYTLEAMKNG